MDMRSFSLNSELTVMVVGSEEVAKLDAIIDMYQANVSIYYSKIGWPGRAITAGWITCFG